MLKARKRLFNKAKTNCKRAFFRNIADQAGQWQGALYSCIFI